MSSLVVAVMVPPTRTVRDVADSVGLRGEAAVRIDQVGRRVDLGVLVVAPGRQTVHG